MKNGASRPKENKKKYLACSDDGAILSYVEKVTEIPYIKASGG